jgi:small subunit ribosomal protein S1
MSTETVNHPKDVVKEEEELDLRIIRIEPARRRLGLSIKQVADEEYAAATAAVERPEKSDFEDVFDTDRQG